MGDLESKCEPEDVLCPRCYADIGAPCETPSGDLADSTHVARVRKAASIEHDLRTLGYLPEHGKPLA